MGLYIQMNLEEVSQPLVFLMYLADYGQILRNYLAYFSIKTIRLAINNHLKNLYRSSTLSYSFFGSRYSISIQNITMINKRIFEFLHNNNNNNTKNN
jgi:hypothetical protein